MRNGYMEKFDKIVLIRVEGANINNYLRRVIRNKINIIKLIPISYKEVHLVMNYSEYKKLIEYRSIYKITIIKRLGRLRFIDSIKKNYVLFVFSFIGIIFIIILSRIIFDVQVIHQDSNIRELVLEELYRYDISKYRFKKSYNELERIEDDILNNNKDKLEWIEIISYGTKYVVKVQERKINDEREVINNRDIVSKKNAVIVRIDAISGEKIKNVNDYVKIGDVIIAGEVVLPDNTIVKKPAIGNVYGEVWYQIDMKYPYIYQESNITGKSRNVYVINFFNKNINIFNFNKYKTFHSKDKELLCFNLIDVCLIKQRQYELRILDEVYTVDMVKYKALEYISNKLLFDNSDIKEVKDVKVLNSEFEEDGVRFKLFVRTMEDIGRIVNRYE